MCDTSRCEAFVGALTCPLLCLHKSGNIMLVEASAMGASSVKSPFQTVITGVSHPLFAKIVLLKIFPDIHRTVPTSNTNSSSTTNVGTCPQTK
jgi:hypothetical protein